MCGPCGCAKSNPCNVFSVTMLTRSKARTNLAFFAVNNTTEMKIKELEKIGINDHGTPIKMGVLYNGLETISDGSTADEMLPYLGPFCPDLTAAVRSSSIPDTHDALQACLETMKPNGFDADEIHRIDGCNYGDPHAGSVSFQWYIIECPANAWVAIECVWPGGWSPGVSSPAVFEIINPQDFHEFFSIFPGILAICGDQTFIAEPDANVDPNTPHLIDVARLTSDADGNMLFDNKPVTFVFGGM